MRCAEIEAKGKSAVSLFPFPIIVMSLFFPFLFCSLRVCSYFVFTNSKLFFLPNVPALYEDPLVVFTFPVHGYKNCVVS